MKESEFNIVYKITNTINGRIYVGVHKTDKLEDGYMGSGKRIKYEIQKYGLLHFTKEILFNFQTYEEALQKEAEIVNEDFLKRDDVLNMVPGGWDALQVGKLAGKKIKWLFENCPETKQKILEGAQKGREKSREYWLGNTHTEETKQKLRDSHQENKHQQGSKNSNYGNMWISNIEEKMKRLIPSTQEIPEGWVKGRNVWNNIKECNVCKDSFLRIQREYSYEDYQNCGYKLNRSDIYCSEQCKEDNQKASDLNKINHKHCPNGISELHLRIVKEFLESPCETINIFYKSQYNTGKVSHMTVHNALKNFSFYEECKITRTLFSKEIFFSLLNS